MGDLIYDILDTWAGIALAAIPTIIAAVEIFGWMNA